MQHLLHNILELLTYDPKSPMIFSSGLFWGLFLVFMPLYALIKSRRTQMTVFVILFSLFFYYKSSGIFFILLICTSLVDWFLSHAIAVLDKRWQRRAAMIVSICCSLSILGYFKYANFFAWNWAQMVGSNFTPMEIILPVGISFYTFQSISYVVDVYKGRLAPTKSYLDYLFFLSFFPALVAGPIVRADYFLPQLQENRHAERREVYLGLWLIILGIVKKAIIADYIAQFNDLIYDFPLTYTGFENLMGVVGYTMQIYCDFSGYSDMAIGIALIMGFRLMKNFNFPYKSRNLTDFWRRWHISLSTWLRDYVYIPLGGNRKGTVRTYVNNFLTMLIGGLWHGAGWKFVFWGAMHGVGLAVHKACKPILQRIPDVWPVKALSWCVTMLYVSFLWVFFRANTWLDARQIIRRIFTDFQGQWVWSVICERWLWFVMMGVIILMHALPTRLVDRLGDWFIRSPWLLKLIIFLVVVQLVIQFMSAEVAPFIYFQF